MEFGDYSPPARPTLDQQRDALRKGIGRAVMWANSGLLEEGPLLEACLRDQRFDSQIDRSRGDWLWGMIQSLEAAGRFREAIWQALRDMPDEYSAAQHCELARCFAGTGDEAFRARLYEIVERRPFPQRPWLGEEEIIQLDGESAFLFAARVRGQRLAEHDWEWDDGSLTRVAEERFGEERVNVLLSTATDDAVRRFHDAGIEAKRKEAARKEQLSDELPGAASSVQDALQAAEGDTKCIWFRRWAKHASEDDLRTVLRRIWIERNPQVIVNLVRVFAVRAMPDFDARIIDLCRHDDEDVRRMAFNALELIDHPLVREFALAESAKGLRGGDVAALFINNYRPGDEHRILDAMELSDDPDERHWILMQVTKVLEENPDADASRLAVIAYALNPCAHCRGIAVRSLVEQNAAPAWLLDECRHDVDENCRIWAAEARESPETITSQT